MVKEEEFKCWLMSHDIVLWDLSVDFKSAEYSWTLTVFAETVLLLRHNNVTDRKDSQISWVMSKKRELWQQQKGTKHFPMQKMPCQADRQTREMPTTPPRISGIPRFTQTISLLQFPSQTTLFLVFCPSSAPFFLVCLGISNQLLWSQGLNVLIFY